MKTLFAMIMTVLLLSFSVNAQEGYGDYKANLSSPTFVGTVTIPILAITGTSSFVGTSVFTGTLDIDAGLAYVTQSLVVYAVGGPPQGGTDGASITADDGDRHISQIFVPYTTSVTGIFYLVGATGGTDSVVCELFTSAGVLVTGATTAASATASGDIVGAAAEIHNVPFTGGAVSIDPGVYYISVQFDGTTATYAAYEVPGSKFVALTEGGTAWTPASITPGTAYVDSEGPIGGIY